MKRGLSFSFIVLAMFAMASVAGADIGFLLDEAQRQSEHAPVKKAETFLGARAINARAYRSPGQLRKVMIAATDATAIAQARSSGAIEVSDYGSLKLFVIDQPALEAAQSGLHRAGLSSASIAGPLTESEGAGLIVRDDFNVLFLRSGTIDTTAGDAPGTFIGMGRAAGADQASLSREERADTSRLRLIQFIGPVKQAWLEELEASGLEVIAYVPNNAYLVRGDGGARSRLMRSQSGGESFIQWEGSFLNEYKIHPRLIASMSDPGSREVSVAVQFVGRNGRAIGDLKWLKKMASSIVVDAYSVLNYTNVKARIELSRIAELAALDNVINIEPWEPPQLFDERATQIIAGELTSDGKSARGPGYLAWLQSLGFSSNFNFAIDVSDTGLDRGSTSADKLHADFLDFSGRSRVSYARDYTSELDPGDVPGHGTINLSIAGGASISAAAGARDSLGFNHGLGAAPFALLGSSKIFQASGRFDLVDPYTKLISEAYLDGARISSNSWGATSNSYTIDSLEYDARTRDAVPSQPGNQEMVILFAAGNAGLNKRISSPSTAKNVISVGAGENSRKDGIDGCGVRDEGADSAMDMANFSSGGPVDDGRYKPDICAPGSHIQGAASQHPDFNGLLVCGENLDNPYFPKGQTLYTWSSGTSHSTPQAAGAAALVRQFFLNRGEEPSAALIKALMVNTPTYMTGELAGGDLPASRQGWGLLSLGRAFNSVPKIFVNQAHTLGDSGQEFVLTGEVKNTNEPLRVTLAWTDAPGFSGFAPWVNDLDLELTINGQVYRGNNFVGEVSRPGGELNTKDNVESVWLPAGTVGSFVLRVRASNIAGDGVPGNGDSTDQDFALVVYNAERKDVAVTTISEVALNGGSDGAADPGEAVSLRLGLKNASPAALTGGRATLTTSTEGVAVTAASIDLPNIAPGESLANLGPFAVTINRSVACGSAIQFMLEVTDQRGALSRIAFTVLTGSLEPIELLADGAESGEARWTHGSLIKKKKNRTDTWTISGKRFRTGGKAWFTPDLQKTTDAHLSSLPLSLPANGRNIQLVFYHTFEFERGEFDGGVVEISTGGDFEDLGPKILKGRYNGTIFEFSSNPLADRAGWVEGRLGQFQQVIVDLSSYAGKTVTIRFRIGTDESGKGAGWYIDDIVLRGDRVSCAPVTLTNE